MKREMRMAKKKIIMSHFERQESNNPIFRLTELHPKREKI